MITISKMFDFDAAHHFGPWVTLAHALGKPCHVGRISGRARVCLVKSWGADSIDSCVPLWSEENLQAVINGLNDPPVEFDLVPAEFFLRSPHGSL